MRFRLCSKQHGIGCQRVLISSRSNRLEAYPTTRCGMTVIELLVSMTLTALLLVFVLTVLGSFTRRQNYMESQEDQSSHQPLMTQIRFDLLNSRRLVWRPNHLTLVGFAGRDFKTGRVLHFPTEITYTIEKLASESWLMRHERHFNSASNSYVRSEAVAGPVNHFSIESTTEEPFQPDVAMPIPAKVRVSFAGTSGEPNFEEYLFLR
jgi:hypothetical protein